jgi:predicted nuclease of predicted toxin-antitoxin system
VKLLLDQNLSFRLVKKLEVKFPGTEQVKRLNLTNKSDRDIWEFAKQKNDSLTYVIQDHEIFYHSECMERDLLYLKIQIEGKMYTYDFLTLHGLNKY